MGTVFEYENDHESQTFTIVVAEIKNIYYSYVYNRYTRMNECSKQSRCTVQLVAA